jgi:hypothetical protein
MTADLDHIGDDDGRCECCGRPSWIEEVCERCGAELCSQCVIDGFCRECDFDEEFR